MGEVGFDKLVKKNANTDDTLRLIVHTAVLNSTKHFAMECAKQLCPKGTSKSDCMRNIFDFYCRNVNYKLDPDGTEKVYTPNRTIIEGEGDCKKAATFIASVLLAAGIEPVFKHVLYAGNNKYTHIYIIVGNPNSYVTLDPTNGCKYDSEVEYSSGTLYYPSGRKMELRAMGKVGLFNDISQVGWSENIGAMESDIHSISCNMMGAARPATKLTHTVVMNKLLPNNPALKKSLEKIPVASQRGSFLTLIQNNYNGIATALAAALAKDPNALNDLWKTVGGDLVHLKTEVLKGATMKPSTATELKGPEFIGFSFKHLLHACAGILHVVAAVVSVIPGVGTAAGAVLNNLGDKAEAIATDPNLPDVTANNKNIDVVYPPDPTGVIVPNSYQPHHGKGGGMQHGSFLSIGSFIFKSVLLISILHINQDLKNLLGTIALVAPLIYLVVKNKSKWILQK